MNDNATNANATNPDLCDDLQFGRTTRSNGGRGRWVSGSVAGHRFEALVFPEHAAEASWEIGGDSRISKLRLARQADGATVYNWDRGSDVPPADTTVAQIVEFLAAGLAEHVYPDPAV